MTRDIKGTEHDFSLDQPGWERAVFDNAAYFTTFRRISRFEKQRKEFKAFPDAVAEARSTNPPALVYAVTATERFVMLPPAQWDTLIAVWQTRTRNGVG